MSETRRKWAFLTSYQIATLAGRTQLDRLQVVRTPWFGVYLHVIHGPDLDRDPHDHPWPFVSVVLAGEYTETVVTRPGCAVARHVHVRSRFSAHLMRTLHAHRITEVRGPVWTLMLTGRHRRRWGFWTPGGWVEQEEYKAAQGPDSYGADAVITGTGPMRRVT